MNHSQKKSNVIISEEEMKKNQETSEKINKSME
jgi:hypothetical protein